MLPFSAQELLIILETQVDSVIPEMQAEMQVDTFSPPRCPLVFLASLLDSVVPPNRRPDSLNHDSFCPPPLPLVQVSVIQETQ